MPTTTPMATPPPTIRPKNQPSGVFDVSTMPAIFCVTDLKLWPGAITAYSPVTRVDHGIDARVLHGSFSRHLCQLRMRVDDSGRIGGARTEVEIGEYLVVALLSAWPLPPCLPASLILPKVIAAGRAGLLACRHNLAITNLARFSLSAVDLSECSMRCTQ